MDETDSSYSSVKHFLFLYLNEDTFQHHADDLTGILKHAIDNKDVELILLHEQDPKRKGCKFDEFIRQTPNDLKEEPYELYSRSIAVPLHSFEDYRELGMKRLLCKLGAEEVREGLCTRVSNSFRYSSVASYS